MKQSFLVSFPIALLGTLLAAIPSGILPVCAVQAGAAPMKCHWSGMVLSGFGVAFIVVGILLVACKSSGVRVGISMMAVLMAALAAAVPTYLVGVCAMPTMPCRTGTYPAVMIVLVLVALAGLANVFIVKYGENGKRDGNETSHDFAPGAE